MPAFLIFPADHPAIFGDAVGTGFEVLALLECLLGGARALEVRLDIEIRSGIGGVDALFNDAHLLVVRLLGLHGDAPLLVGRRQNNRESEVFRHCLTCWSRASQWSASFTEF